MRKNLLITTLSIVTLFYAYIMNNANAQEVMESNNKIIQYNNHEDITPSNSVKTENNIGDTQKYLNALTTSILCFNANEQISYEINDILEHSFKSIREVAINYDNTNQLDALINNFFELNILLYQNRNNEKIYSGLKDFIINFFELLNILDSHYRQYYITFSPITKNFYRNLLNNLHTCHEFSNDDETLWYNIMNIILEIKKVQNNFQQYVNNVAESNNYLTPLTSLNKQIKNIDQYIESIRETNQKNTNNLTKLQSKRNILRRSTNRNKIEVLKNTISSNNKLIEFLIQVQTNSTSILTFFMSKLESLKEFSKARLKPVSLQTSSPKTKL